MALGQIAQICPLTTFWFTAKWAAVLQGLRSIGGRWIGPAASVQFGWWDRGMGPTGGPLIAHLLMAELLR